MSSARAALVLRGKGFRSRPLLGGLVAWRERGFPLEPVTLPALPELLAN